MNECTEISRKVAQGDHQKKFIKFMEKALEKFRLSAPSSNMISKIGYNVKEI